MNTAKATEAVIPVLESTPRIIGMRDAFFERLFELFVADDKCFFITADNGAPTMDRFAQELPDRFATVGIAEQQMIGMAAGLALEGYKVYTYAIAPFVTTRVHEQVKLDVCAHDLDVCMIGVGAGYAYDIMGPSHHTVEDISIMRVYRNMNIWSPADTPTARRIADLSYNHKGPQYLRLDRVGIPDLPAGGRRAGVGLQVFGTDSEDYCDVCIVSTGAITHTALEAAELLRQHEVRVRVVDVYQIGAASEAHLAGAIGGCSELVTLEEHMLAGGLGSWVLEVLNDVRAMPSEPVLRLGVPGTFTYDYGGREVIREKYGLTAPQVVQSIRSVRGTRLP